MDGFQPNLPSSIRSSNRIIDKYIKPEIPYLSKRYTVAILTCLGFIISFGTQTEVPIVPIYKKIIDHVFHNKAKSPVLQCNKDNYNKVEPFGIFQEVLWIYLGQITGGFLAYMYPAQKVFGIAIALQIELNFLYALPFENCVIFEVIRILQTFFQFVAYVACVGIWSHWAPLQDRSCLLAISYCGTHVGIFISRYLRNITESIKIDAFLFLIYGIIGFIWFIIWTWLVFEKPRDHPSISKSELKHIESSLKCANNSSAPSLANIPWKQMFTSKPVYALLIIYCCQLSDYVEDLYISNLNTYLFNKKKNILKELILNQILPTVFMLFGGFLADIIKKYSSLSTTNIRKLFISILITAEVLFGSLLHFPLKSLNSILPGINEVFNLMFNISCLDAAPKYATLMMSISRVIFLIKSHLLNEIKSLNYYDNSIIVLWSVTIYFIGIIFYLKLGSSDTEPWSKESFANDHLANENQPITLQGFLANTNAHKINQSNKQPHVGNTSFHTRTSYSIIKNYIKPKIPYFNKRYTIVILTWLGFIVSFGAQTNAPLIENEITDNGFTDESILSGTNNIISMVNLQSPFNNTFEMDQQNDVITTNFSEAFYTVVYRFINSLNFLEIDVYWNLFGQIIGGFIAYMYPAQRVFGIAIFLQTVFNFFLAIPYESGIQFEVIRKLQESLQFVAYVACVGIWRHWAPSKERPCLLAISYCGPHVGLLIGEYFFRNLGVMSNSTNHLLIYGIIGIIWFAVWTWLVFEKPRKHPSISEEELKYIESSLETDTNTNAPSLGNVPWKQMFTSKPVYALIIVNSCKIFNYCHCLSVFKNNFNRKSTDDEIHMGVNSNLILSSIVMLFGGFMKYFFREIFCIPTIIIRKLFISAVILLESLFAFLYYLKNVTLKFKMLSFSGTFNLVFIISCLDVAPKYATILMSFSIASNVITEYLLSENTALTGFLQHGKDSLFFLVWVTFLQFVGVIFYLKLASSDKQRWSEESNVNDHLTSVNKSVHFQENLNRTYANNMVNSGNIEQRIQNASAGNPFDQPPSRLIDKYIKPEIPCLSKRYTMAILTFFGFAAVYVMQCTIHNVSLEQIFHMNKEFLDVFINQRNASLEKLNNDYKAFLEEFENMHKNSQEEKIKFMFNETVEGGYSFNQSLEKKFNRIKTDSLFILFFHEYEKSSNECNQEYYESVEVNNKDNTSLVELNYSNKNSLEKMFDCIYNKSLETLNYEYNKMLNDIYYMYYGIQKKKCDQITIIIAYDIKRSFNNYVQLDDAFKIAKLIKRNCKKSYWEKDFLAFVFGNAMVQIPGGILAYLYPAHKIFGAAIGLSSLINLCTTIVYNEIMPKYVILFFQGLVQGLMYPACYGIWRHWAPPFERSRLSTISFCGLFVGIVIGIPSTKVLKDNLGWKVPYYTYGAAGLLWYIVWTWLTFEKPSHHPSISEQERNYIQSSLGSSNGPTTPSLFKYIPWKQMFTSKSVWAIIVADFCHMWNSVLILLTVAKEINLSLSTEQFYVIIPILFASIIIILGGVLADYLIRKSILCTTNVRKVFTCGGFTVEAFIILLSALSSWTEVTRTHICLISSITFSGLAFSGFNVNHLDIAPRYASVLLGITSGISLMALTMFFPVVTHVISIPELSGDGISALEILAFLTMCLQFVGDIFYSSCASGEHQPWAEPVFNEQYE